MSEHDEVISVDEHKRLLAEHDSSLQAELERFKDYYTSEFETDESEGKDLARKARKEVLKSGESAAKRIVHLMMHADKEEVSARLAIFVYNECKDLISDEKGGLEELLEQLRAGVT